MQKFRQIAHVYCFQSPDSACWVVESVAVCFNIYEGLVVAEVYALKVGVAEVEHFERGVLAQVDG